MSEYLRCAVVSHGVQCELEAGHPGPHHVERELPAEIGQLIDQLWTEGEQELKRLKKARRSLERARWLLLLAVGVNIGVVIMNVMTGL